jgi:site-specific recombinase XerD
MIEDIAMRKLSSMTQQGYVRSVKRFLYFFGRSPDEAEAEDLRRSQQHLARSGVSAKNITNAILTSLRFLYCVTLSRSEVLAKVTTSPKSRSC